MCQGEDKSGEGFLEGDFWVKTWRKLGNQLVHGGVRSSWVLRPLWLEWRGEDEKDGIMIMAHVLSQAKC